MKTLFILKHADDMPDGLEKLLNECTVGVQAAPGIALARAAGDKWLAVVDDGEALHFVATESRKGPSIKDIRAHVQLSKQRAN
jgi:hypothetical protein